MGKTHDSVFSEYPLFPMIIISLLKIAQGVYLIIF